MLDDRIMKQMTNLDMKNSMAHQYYEEENEEYSGAEDYDYEVK